MGSNPIAPTNSRDVENFALVAQQVAVLFAVMVVGALARWMRLVDDAGVKSLTNVLIYIVTPCLIVDVFRRPFDSSTLGALAFAFAAAVIIHFVMIGLSRVVVRAADENVNKPLLLAAVFSNAGFMGLPLEQGILGPDGVFYGAVYVAVFNLFIWSWGYRTMGNGADGARVSLRSLVNPGTTGLLIGLALFLSSARLPAFLATPVHQLAELNTPLAMLVIGSALPRTRLGPIFRLRAAALAALLRLFVCPFVAMAILFPFRHTFPRELLLALTIAASAPVAAMTVMFAVKFDRDVGTGVALVSGTTLLSLVTMPTLVALAMWVL